MEKVKSNSCTLQNPHTIDRYIKSGVLKSVNHVIKYINFQLDMHILTELFGKTDICSQIYKYKQTNLTFYSSNDSVSQKIAC